MKSPFASPEETDRASVEHIAKAAITINQSLAEGNRRFTVNVGILDGVVGGLDEVGWEVKVEERGDAQGTFLVTGRKPGY